MYLLESTAAPLLAKKIRAPGSAARVIVGVLSLVNRSVVLPLLSVMEVMLAFTGAWVSMRNVAVSVPPDVKEPLKLPAASATTAA